MTARFHVMGDMNPEHKIELKLDSPTMNKQDQCDLVLYAYKHRTQTPYDKKIKLSPARAWFRLITRTIKCNISKYPNHIAYRAIDIPVDEESGIMPAKAFICGEFLNRKFGFNLQYTTVLSGSKTSKDPTTGLILLDVEKTNISPSTINYSSLKKKIWCQGTSDDLHLLIQLELFTSYSGVLMQDDVTGEVYCYRPSQIIMLLPKPD
jgi:hypothetical protein